MSTEQEQSEPGAALGCLRGFAFINAAGTVEISPPRLGDEKRDARQVP